jgi:hypothetical protein
VREKLFVAGQGVVRLSQADQLRLRLRVRSAISSATNPGRTKATSTRSAVPVAGAIDAF